MAKIDLCKLFEVEPNEEFELSGVSGTLKINEKNEIMFKRYVDKWEPFVEQINITAQREVEKLPFVPKKGETYWFADTISCVGHSYNDYCEEDVNRVKLGNCFKTEKEATEKGVPLMNQFVKELGW